jgi:hypothetical protein
VRLARCCGPDCLVLAIVDCVKGNVAVATRLLVLLRWEWFPVCAEREDRRLDNSNGRPKGSPDTIKGQRKAMRCLTLDS